MNQFQLTLLEKTLKEPYEAKLREREAKLREQEAKMRELEAKMRDQEAKQVAAQISFLQLILMNRKPSYAKLFSRMMRT